MASPPKNHVDGGIFRSIPFFDGNVNKLTGFIREIDFAQTQGNWSEEITASTAIRKLEKEAATWATPAMALEDAPWTKKWSGVDGLKAALIQRFDTVPQLAVERQFRRLEQRQEETVASFVDRIRHQLSLRYALTPAADKKTQSFKNKLEEETWRLLQSGIHPHLYRILFWGHNPPTTVTEALARAKIVEVDQKAMTSQVTTLAIHEREDPQAEGNEEDTASNDETDDELSHLMDTVMATFYRKKRQGKGRRFNPRGRSSQGNGANPANRGNNQCFACKGYGHWAHECPSRKTRGVKTNAKYARAHDRAAPVQEDWDYEDAVDQDPPTREELENVKPSGNGNGDC